jgi:UDP-N-acetylglucosamine pyrophosphorylase
MSEKNFLNLTGAVILAAGRGTRLGCTDMPKVMLELGGKPMVAHTVETLKSIGLPPERICVVVGFCKEKVMGYFGYEVTFAVQTEQKGTAHAAHVGMVALPPHVSHVLVMGGDDSAFYNPQTLESFIFQHVNNNNILTLLTAEMKNPSQNIGRVVRNKNGEVEIVEKERITEEQKKLKEISTGTFVFNREWFEAMFPSMPPIPTLNEFGLPMALTMAREAGLKHEVVKLANPDEWFGVNTPQELAEAQRRKNILVL